MKISRLFAAPLFLSLSLLGGSSTPSAITGICDAGGDPAYPDCASGQVTFTGSNYPNRVRVVVTNSSGLVIDNSVYDTTNGDLSFTEDMSFPDTYTVTIKHGGNLNGGSVLDVETVTTI